MANAPYPYRDRSQDHRAPWQDDDGVFHVDGRAAFVENWNGSRLEVALIYPATRKAVIAALERRQVTRPE